MIGRLVGLLIIGFSLIIQVFAITVLFDTFELFDTAWREPFFAAGKLYGIAIATVANALTNVVGEFASAVPASQSILSRIVLPCWWVHVLAMYIGASVGIYGGTIAFGSRKIQVNEFLRGGLSVAWPATIAAKIFQGVRNQPVTNFVNHHNGVTFFYALTALAMYAGANWMNINVLTGPVGEGQEVSIINDVPCPKPAGFGDGLLKPSNED
ncbi:MAG: hypothetical protein AAF830_01515 [Pseudomonadota bacterium]